MKKVDCFFLGMLISIIFLTTIFMVNILIRTNAQIYIKDVNDYMGKITAMKDDIASLKVADACRMTLYEIADNINATHFSTSQVKVKDYIMKYRNIEPLTQLVMEAKDNCSLADTDAIYVLAMSSMVFPEEVENSYAYRYEFHIPDYLSRQSRDKNHQEVGSFTTKSLELRVLKELIEVLS